jgi:hypothetical protein
LVVLAQVLRLALLLALRVLSLAVLQALHYPRLFNSLVATLSAKQVSKKVVANLSKLTPEPPALLPFLKLPWMWQVRLSPWAVVSSAN